MSVKFFLDTNILVYAVDQTNPQKHAIAREWLTLAHESGAGVISYQVVQEWLNTVLRKPAVRIGVEGAEEHYRTLLEPLWRIDSSRAIVQTALDLFRHNSFSWWDSMIVGAAIEANCSVLLSEDLQHGREIMGLRIENPFQ